MATTQLETRVFLAPAREVGRRGATFSPTTATLVVGQTDMVLIDTQFIDTEITALGDMIERLGKRLSAIYVTHAHADHYLGAGMLQQRFPDARVLATAAVTDAINQTLDEQIALWRNWFGDAAVEPTVLPSALDADVIDLEGHELQVIEVGQGDIAPSTIVHIPAIDTVIAGDVAYNRIHPMLAFSGPNQWQAWIDSIDQIERLHPGTVIAGHKAADANDRDIAAILDGTRDYIRDFSNAVTASSDAEEIVKLITAKYPNYGNLTTLHVSAQAACSRAG
jgi:glyoxylase-like metal-dependent hydrolase (beta-lactamase superfamily II)